MTPLEFCQWLQGYLELRYTNNTFHRAQVQKMLSKLTEVANADTFCIWLALRLDEVDYSTKGYIGDNDYNTIIMRLGDEIDTHYGVVGLALDADDEDDVPDATTGLPAAPVVAVNVGIQVSTPKPDVKKRLDHRL